MTRFINVLPCNRGLALHDSLSCTRRFGAEGYRTALLARGETTLRALEADVPGSRGYVYEATEQKSAERVFARHGPSNWICGVSVRIGTPTG